MTQQKTTDPEFIYSKSIDKQRVVIAGSQARTISALVLYVLHTYQREFDFVTEIAPSWATESVKLSDAPVVLVQESEHILDSLLKYHHHIVVLSDIPSGEESAANRLADATPKGGIVIYNDAGVAQRVGKKERPDSFTIPYKAYPHSIEAGKVVLISSTNTQVPISLSGETNLRSISAAKEVLKKLGITSGQFYKAVTTFTA